MSFLISTSTLTLINEIDVINFINVIIMRVILVIIEIIDFFIKNIILNVNVLNFFSYSTR